MIDTKIINHVNSVIVKLKLEKIIEMTYSYKEIDKDIFYNITLFEEFAWVKYSIDKNIDFESLRSDVYIKLKLAISEIEKLIAFLRENTFDYKLEILYKSLQYIYKILEVVVLWLDFELEKAWYKIVLSVEEQEEKIRQIEDIEEENFWLKIKNSKSEIKMIYDYLFWLFINKKSKLLVDEQIFFMSYISKINTYLNEKNLEVNFIKKKKVKLQFWDKIISRDNYIKLFNYILENIYWLEQRAIITNASSIYDWEKFLEIPDKETHANLTYKRVLELIVHEIESHYINWYNNKILLWEFRWARNLEKEEWLAKIMEAFLNWDTLETMNFIPIYMAKILFSEIYSWDDFYKFIDIYNKMHTLRRKPTNEFLRQKRNYSLSLGWGQHKDISYGRWMIKTIDYLKNWWDFSLLFMSKVWFEDLDKINNLYEENKDNIVFPIFIWDIIQLDLQFKEQWKNIDLNIDLIVNYLEKKYNFKWIDRFNLKENIWKKMDKINDILDFIEKIDN